jgi:hypothetical protein
MATSSSLPTKLNFRIKQGDTFNRVITISLDEEPVDLSTATVAMIIDGQDDLSESDGLSVGGGDNNVITINKVISWSGSHKYEIRATFASGLIKTYYEGTITSRVKLT